MLVGTAANDILIGGAGNDILAGGAGSDSLTGELGDDVYVFADATAAETDTVQELSGEGTDRLDFSGLSAKFNVTLNLSSTTTSQAVHTSRSLAFAVSTTANNFEEVIGGGWK